MRKILVFLVLISTTGAWANQGNPFQDPNLRGALQGLFNNMEGVQEMMQEAGQPMDAETQKALELMQDKEVSDKTFGMLEQLTRPVDLTEAQCMQILEKHFRQAKQIDSQVAAAENEFANKTKAQLKQEIMQANYNDPRAQKAFDDAGSMMHCQMKYGVQFMQKHPELMDDEDFDY